MPAKLIELEKLKKTFQMGGETIRALDEVSFSIDEGEWVSITGPSGCGKSTLMNILGLLDQPTHGIYRLDSREAQKLSDDEMALYRNQKIGFVFQSFHLMPRATALRNVEMPMVYAATYQKGLHEKKIKEAAEIALEKVGLKDRMHHRPNELSGGQRQRVAIARALVNNPRLLLADEPTGNLDSKVGAEILQIFEELHRQGVTVIMVTHDPLIAAKAKRVIAMKDGKVLRDERVVS